MKRLFLIMKLFFEIFRCLPHLVLFYLHKNKTIIQADTNRWLTILHVNFNKPIGFLYLLSFKPEFRNLFYKRIGLFGNILNVICPKMSSLIIDTEDIGEGLFIQHGVATVIGAKSIGINCWINQQVTIGYSNETDAAVLLNNVKIDAGAMVIGKVIIGSNSEVGANAVVVKSVPENCVVVGVPAYIIKRNGVKVHEKL